MSNTSFSDALRPLRVRRPQAVREREILRLAATLGGADGKKAAAAARSEILKWAKRRTSGEFPPAAWEHEEFEHLAGGRNCAAVRIINDSQDIWAMRADDPDKEVAQRIWTTEVVVAHLPRQRALLSLRLLASSPERKLRIEPAVPGLVQQLASECGIGYRAEQLDASPWHIKSKDDGEHLIDRLVDSNRRTPFFVLTVPKGASNPRKPLIDPLPIARATLGLAMIAVLPARFTRMLTERFGEQLSVHDGAVRVYLPGFTEDADPYGEHDLLFVDSLSTKRGRSRVSALLRQIAATESLRQLRLGHDVLPYAAVRALSLDLKRTRLEDEGASHTEQLSAAQVQVAKLTEDLGKAEEDQQWLSDEHGMAENRAQNLEIQLKAAKYRIQQLLDQMKTHGENPDATISLPAAWKEFANWCEKNLGGRVVLSSRARREVKAPKFEDVAMAARCLLWLANDYRERRSKGGGEDLQITFENGIKNTRCGADKFRIEWRGKNADIKWHIKNGGNTRAPGRCLRIYYFWDKDSNQVVIASMPAHIRTPAT